MLLVLSKDSMKSQEVNTFAKIAGVQIWIQVRLGLIGFIRF
jgi:hypothetical protein